jgi:hypothetical protein
VTSTIWRDRARTAALALVVFALAHNLTFLLTFGEGSDAALARTGHGAQWTATVVLVVVLALALVAAGALRLAQLSRLAGAVDRAESPSAGTRTKLRLIGRAWLQILVGALALFVAAENLEHVAAGLVAPGLSVLGSGDYHDTLAVFAGVAFAAALVEGLYRWRREVLIARIVSARARWTGDRQSSARPNLPWIDPRHGAIVNHQIAGRAPPRPIAL